MAKVTASARAGVVKQATSRATARSSAALLCGIILVSLSACTSAPSPTLRITPSSSRSDQGLAIQLHGVAPAATVKVSVSMPDNAGSPWTGTGTYVADQEGFVDANAAPSTGGTYSGAHSMGLLSSMQPASATSGTSGFYVWPAGPQKLTWTATVEGREVARTTTLRALTQPPETRVDLSKGHDGIVGSYFASPDGSRHPAVLVLGGSEGGDPAFLAAALAARGIPALAQAYFDAPGLPPTATRIPLETFDAGLAWLRSRPEVDPERIWIFGGSRGSEAALLEGVRRPDLVHGVIAASPSNVAHGSYPVGGPGWTVNGQPVPYVVPRSDPQPADQPAAVIPVQKLKGPLIAVCGERDTVWTSCDAARVMSAQLNGAGGSSFTLLDYPDAGHFVDALVPYVPQRADSYEGGTSAQSDSDARADAWPKVLTQILGTQSDH